MDMIIWKDVIGYEGLYLVSNTGLVKSLPRKSTSGILMKTYLDRSKRHLSYQRPTLRLSKNGKTSIHRVCRLVAEAFIPNKNNSLTVNHKNYDPTDNRVENLEWLSASDNAKYSVKNFARGEKHGRSKLKQSQVDIIRTELKYKKVSDIAIEFNVSDVTIRRIKNNHNWINQ
jgi:hypothetical protein